MKWQGGRRGGKIEDRRGMSTGGKVAVGGIGGVIILLIGMFMGVDPTQLLQQIQPGGATQGAYQSAAEAARLLQVADGVLASTDDDSTRLLQQAGASHPKPG